MITPEERLIVLRILTTRGIGPRAISRIIDKSRKENLSLASLMDLSAAEFARKFNLDLQIAKYFFDNDSLAKRLWEEIEKKGIDILLKGMEEYPSHLRNTLTNDAPPVLFYKGKSVLLKKAGVGFCGSRKASIKGLAIASDCASILAHEGLNVVSGYAYGVDLSAHKGALENGGTTTIVLAEGILHFELKSDIKDLATDSNTIIISEFSPRLPWQARQAMLRNKTIIGLSNAMILIESDKKGGTFAAGQSTLEYHRPLFVVEYGEPPESANGNSYFLQRGAQSIRKNKEGIPNLDNLIKIVLSEHAKRNDSGPKNGKLFEDDADKAEVL